MAPKLRIRFVSVILCFYALFSSIHCYPELKERTLNAIAWGYNQDGQLGRGYTSLFGEVDFLRSPSPQAVTSPTSFRQVAVGTSSVLAIDEVSGQAFSWGSNRRHELFAPYEDATELGTSHLVYPTLVELPGSGAVRWVGTTHLGSTILRGNNFYSTVMGAAGVNNIYPAGDAFVLGDCTPYYCATVEMFSGSPQLRISQPGVSNSAPESYSLDPVAETWTSMSIDVNIGNSSLYTVISTNGSHAWAFSTESNLVEKFNGTLHNCGSKSTLCSLERFWAPYKLLKVKMCDKWTFFLSSSGTIFQFQPNTTASGYSNPFINEMDLRTWIPWLNAVDFTCAANTLLIVQTEFSSGTTMQYVVSWPLNTIEHSAMLGHHQLRSAQADLKTVIDFYRVSKFKSSKIRFSDSTSMSFAVIALVDLDSFSWDSRTYSGVSWGQGDLSQLMSGQVFAANDFSSMALIPNEWPTMFPFNHTHCHASGSMDFSSISCDPFYVRFSGLLHDSDNLDSVASIHGQTAISHLQRDIYFSVLHALPLNGYVAAVHFQEDDTTHLRGFSDSIPELNILEGNTLFTGPETITSIKCGSFHCGFVDSNFVFYLFGANDTNQIIGTAYGPALGNENRVFVTELQVQNSDHYALGSTFSAVWQTSIGSLALIGGSLSMPPFEYFTIFNPGLVLKVAAGDILVLLVEDDVSLNKKLYEWSSAATTRESDDLKRLDLDHVTDIAVIGRTGFALVTEGGQSSVWAWGRTPLILSDLDPFSAASVTPRIPYPIPMPRSDIVPTALCTECKGQTMIVLTESFSELYRPPVLPSSPDPSQSVYRTCFGRNEIGQCGLNGAMSIKSFGLQFSDFVWKSAVVLGERTYAINETGALYAFGRGAGADERPYGPEGFNKIFNLTGDVAMPPQAAVGPYGIPTMLLSPNTARILATTDRLLMVPEYSPSLVFYVDVAADYSIAGMTTAKSLSSPVSKICTALDPSWSAQWTYLLEGGGYATSNTIVWNALPLTTNITEVLYGNGWQSIWWTDAGVRRAKGFGLLADLDGALVANASSISHGESHFICMVEGQVRMYGTNNEFGQLGSEPTFSTASILAGHVSFTHIPGSVERVFAARWTNYALFDSGAVAVWGWNGPWNLFCFAHPKLTSNIPLLVPWTPSSNSRVTDIVVLGESVHFTMMDALNPSPQISCGPEPSIPNFGCINGIWILVGNVISPGVAVVIGSPTIVIGNVSLDQIVFTFPENTLSGPILTIQGCAEIEGLIEIQITEEQLKTMEKQKTTVLDLITAQCGFTTAQLKATSEKSCRKAKVSQTTTQTPQGGFTLSATFKVDASACRRWWIILVSVLGGVILLVTIAAIIATQTSLKTKIRPFMRRT